MDAVPSMLEYIVRGAASAVLPMNLLVMFIGLVVGIVGGMLPGITTVTAVALFVPFTFSMPPDMALIGLGGVFCGAMYGGANAAILINTPGTPGSIATSLDGYPLVMQGRAEEACYIALLASVLGGIFGTVVLMLFFEPLSVMALKFGSEAFFWMGLFGLSTLAAMFPGNIAKGLLGGAIGLALCTVGLDPVMGMPRFTFGCFDLVQGLDMVALMIGLFSLSQMFVMLESDEKYIVKMERRSPARAAVWPRSSPTMRPSGGTRTPTATARAPWKASSCRKAPTTRAWAVRWFPCSPSASPAARQPPSSPADSWRRG